MSLHVSPRGEANVAPDPPPWWTVAIGLFAALVLQSAVEPLVALRGAIPSLVLLLVLWYGLRTDLFTGLLFGTIAGACEDALAGWTGAAWTVATAIVGALAGRAAGSPVSETHVRVVAFVALATALRYAIFAIALRTEGVALPIPLTHFHALVWQCLANAALAYALVRLAPRLSVSHVVGIR